jgi:hypothetical protein
MLPQWGVLLLKLGWHADVILIRPRLPCWRSSMPAIALLAVLFACVAVPATAEAQGASVTARLSGGQTAQVRAAPTGADGVLLEFLLPNGRSQSFPQLGESLIPLDGKGGAGLVARDLNGDGVDEVLIRGLVPPDKGALLVFRWNQSAGEFVPLTFTDDRDRTNPFAVVDARQPVILHPSGEIEVQFETTRQDGRKSSHVARYRWTGKGYSQSTDN